MREAPADIDMKQVADAWQEARAAAQKRFDAGDFEDPGYSDGDRSWMFDIAGVPSDVSVLFFVHMEPLRAERRLVTASCRITVWPIGEEQQDEAWALVDEDFEFVEGGIQPEPELDLVFELVWRKAAEALSSNGPFMAKKHEIELEASTPGGAASRKPRI